jgi:hypothetical protein
VRLTARQAIARAAGRPYDDARVTLFQTLAAELQQNPLQVPPVDPSADSRMQAFIETYFSNYIEGTEFEIEEAHDIVVQGRPLRYREDDSHDILGTHQAILKSKADPAIPQNFEAFAELLQAWNLFLSLHSFDRLADGRHYTGGRFRDRLITIRSQEVLNSGEAQVKLSQFFDLEPAVA